MPPGDPLLVAAHWPYVRRQLELSRRRPLAQALDLLARLQWEGGGEPVPLGRRRLAACENPQAGRPFTPGEAGAIWHALARAEHGGVVVRWRGSGRRPDAWSLRGDVEHWRAMPWILGARDVGRVIRACRSSTFCAVAARNPGQSVAPRREFWLSGADHLAPPGLLPVDSRDYGASRAATAQRPGTTPVDSRGYGRGAGGLSFPSEEPSVLREEDERVELLLRGIERATPGQRRGPNGRAVWGAPLRALAATAAMLTADEARRVAGRLAGVEGSYGVRLVTTAAELAQQERARSGGRRGDAARLDLESWGTPGVG